MTSSLPSRDECLATLTSRCPDVDSDVLRDFASRMDLEYFSHVPLDQVAWHVRLAARLTPVHPCELSVMTLPNGQTEITVVAYDYFSEFAIICGLMSSFGLTIDEGRIYTFADPSRPSKAIETAPWPPRRAKSRPGLSRKKIIDVFQVRSVTGNTFTEADQEELRRTLTQMIQLLDSGQFDEARQQVNRRLVERLSKQQSSFSGLLHTVQITFDNSQSPTDTIMDIRSDDTPAFLYAFANALAMRNVYISKAQFAIEDGKLHDRFYVRNRYGQKLTDVADQQQLKLTAVLIKQFTHALTWAPNPAKALEAFDQFLDLIVEEVGRSKKSHALDFVSNKRVYPLLARLLGASDFLWEDFLRRQHGNLLPLLEDYRNAPLIKPQATLRKELDRLVGRAKDDAGRKEALNRFKDRELFRIDMKHVVEPSTSLTDFSLALTELAEVIVDRSLHDCLATLEKSHGRARLENGKPCPFAILGMGKFGGCELGYASDIEVLFVYGGSGRTSSKQKMENSEFFERLAQALLQWIEAKQEGIFHVDIRLRPHGGKGSLANPLDEIISYYSTEGLAAPFERQALIKLRHVAGDAAVGRQVETHRDRYVYSGAPWDLAAALDLRRQQIAQLVERGTINVKQSPGGLVDIEYAVQYLQIMHGHRHPLLKTPNTMQALTGLAEVGIVTKQEEEVLRKAYLFIRMVIDGLRMVRGNTKDLVLPAANSDEFVFLARRVGYAMEDWQAGAAHLQDDLNRHMTRVRTFFASRFTVPP